jgi:hypothetical protein
VESGNGQREEMDSGERGMEREWSGNGQWRVGVKCGNGEWEWVWGWRVVENRYKAPRD